MPKCKVIGLSARVAGTSKKSGKAYDFYNVHICYDDPQIHGQAVKQQSVDTSMMPDGLAPGMDIWIDTNLDGWVTGVRILPEDK